VNVNHARCYFCFRAKKVMLSDFTWVGVHADVLSYLAFTAVRFKNPMLS
jgi:hypothetical protein